MRSFGEYFALMVVLATIVINVLNWTRVRRGNPPRVMPAQRQPESVPARPRVPVGKHAQRDH